jgi:hypothetical protein
MSYGIYTGGDREFFPGMVAAINALRWFGCGAPIAVLDNGLDPWMSEYLAGFSDVHVCDLRPLADVTRYTDVCSDESPVLLDYGFKAFGILHFNLFDRFTFIDADLLPLCDFEAALTPMIERGEFVSAEDGTNEWDDWHAAAIGVEPGIYVNINAGFFSLSMHHHAGIMHEWCHLMTRRKAMDRLFADQGALNVILDKRAVPKTALEPEFWNQTGLHHSMTRNGEVDHEGDAFVHLPTGRRINSWHTAGCPKLWQQLGVDFTGRDPEEVERVREESEGANPDVIVSAFRHFLHLDQFQQSVAEAYAEARNLGMA